jgi:head-tail adaptor
MPQRPFEKGAGDRRHPVDLQSPIESIDVMGGNAIPTWDTYASDFCAVEEISKVVNETEATLFYDLTIPYRSEVENGHQVVVLGKTLKILLVENPRGLNRELILHCAETV